MNPWELTGDEVEDIRAKVWSSPFRDVEEAYIEAGATEAQKKLVRWDNGKCLEHAPTLEGGLETMFRRRDCPYCQQAKLEWAEGGE